MNEKILEELEKIYSLIPDFQCRHCHECEGPIIWFKPEEIMIRDYLEKHRLEYIQWSKEEFERHKWKCPYLQDDRCSIYPVRPIVCRLQGNIPELPCRFNKNRLMSKRAFDKLKMEFEALVKESGGAGMIYSTRKITQI